MAVISNSMGDGNLSGAQVPLGQVLAGNPELERCFSERGEMPREKFLGDIVSGDEVSKEMNCPAGQVFPGLITQWVCKQVYL